MFELKNLTYAQKTCLKKTGLLMHKTRMLHPGAKIGVAVSGGMDSFLLLHLLNLRRRIVPFEYDLMILHINPGFDPEDHAPLVQWNKKAGLAAHIEVSDFGPRAHSEENRKNSPCFYCSMLRRKRLFSLCRDYGLTHLAMGHNLDDLAATFFMNMFMNGRVDGLTPADSYFNGEFMLIRPLLMVEKRHIRPAAAKWGLPYWENSCPSARAGKRANIAEWLDERQLKDRRIKRNIYNAILRWQLDFVKFNN